VWKHIQIAVKKQDRHSSAEVPVHIMPIFVIGCELLTHVTQTGTSNLFSENKSIRDSALLTAD
jgi:hypothetical protein